MFAVTLLYRPGFQAGDFLLLVLNCLAQFVVDIHGILDFIEPRSEITLMRTCNIKRIITKVSVLSPIAVDGTTRELLVSGTENSYVSGSQI